MNKLDDLIATSFSFTVVFTGFHILDTLQGVRALVGLLIIFVMMANGIYRLREFWKDK